MTRAALIRAWAILIGLSLASTLLSVWTIAPQWQALAGSAILTLAWLKARVILAQYLGLAAAPFWARGFGIVLALYCGLLLGLYLIPLML